MSAPAWHLAGLAALGAHLQTGNGWLVLAALVCLLGGLRKTGE